MKRDIKLAFIPFLITQIIYLLTLAPTVTSEDSGEFIAAASKLGVAHPPGYPLFCISGYFFSKIPFESVAWRLARRHDQLEPDKFLCGCKHQWHQYHECVGSGWFKWGDECNGRNVAFLHHHWRGQQRFRKCEWRLADLGGGWWTVSECCAVRHGNH